MNRKIKLSLFIIAISTTIIFLNYKIFTFDMRFYQSKDNGYFVRLESICLMSTLFFLGMSRERRLLNSAIGFLTGLVFSIIWYFLTIYITDDRTSAIVFHVMTCVSFIFSFYLIEKKLDGANIKRTG